MSGKKQTSGARRSEKRQAGIRKISTVYPPYTRWSEKEDAYIRRWYAAKTPESIAVALHRTKNAVKSRAFILKVAQKRTRWTRREIAYIKKFYRRQTPARTAVALGRSRYAILKAAMRWNVPQQRHRYRAAEDRYLNQWYGKKATKMLAAHLGRTPGSVGLRLYRIGLKGKKK